VRLRHALTGQFSRIKVDLTLTQQGPLLANLGTGLLPFYGDINYGYALPSMKTSGSVVVDGKPYQVAGFGPGAGNDVLDWRTQIRGREQGCRSNEGRTCSLTV
jgi:predicted secreted hydrolase